MDLDADFPSDDDVFVKYKTQRVAEMQRETGSLVEFRSEADLVRKSKTNTMIVHFYKPEFTKCEIMNRHLEEVCKSFPGIEFYKINAEKCALVTKKLNVLSLPFLAFFKNGYFVDSVVGFEGLGADWFDPKDLVSLIKSSHIFK